MQKVNILYIGATIGVILFVFFVIVPPTIRIMEQLHFDIQGRWVVLTTIIPIISIILLYSVLSYIRDLHSDRQKEQVKEIIEPDLTEDEIFEETLFENEKMRVLNIIHSFSKIKGRRISLSAIKKKTNFDIDKIEDMILLLMADELLDGHFEYPDDGTIFVLPERKEIKVKYIKDKKENKKDKDKKNNFMENGSELD